MYLKYIKTPSNFPR